MKRYKIVGELDASSINYALSTPGARITIHVKEVIDEVGQTPTLGEKEPIEVTVTHYENNNVRAVFTGDLPGTNKWYSALMIRGEFERSGTYGSLDVIDRD